MSCAGRRTAFLGYTGVLLLLLCAPARASMPEELFSNASQAFRAGDYIGAAESFHKSAVERPAAGTLQNLGNAEWQRGQSGAAILAWEQSLWLNPFQPAPHTNLRFARKHAQLESPELAWYEVVSTWLPVNWWAWIAGLSFWGAVAMTLLPGIFRWRKAGWHQAVAALALTIFLLSVPAHAGIYSRSHLGFVLLKETPLRLTPTAEAQIVARLQAGEPARLERKRGQYLLVRTNRALGWIQQDQFGLICGKP